MESKHRWNQTVIYTSHFGCCFLCGGWKKLTIDSGIPNISTPLDSLLEQFKIGHAVESSKATRKVGNLDVLSHQKPIRSTSKNSLFVRHWRSVKTCQWSMLQVHCNMSTVPTSINRNYSYRLIGYRYDSYVIIIRLDLWVWVLPNGWEFGSGTIVRNLLGFLKTPPEARNRPPRHLLIFDAHAQLLLPPLTALAPACHGTGDLGHEGGSQKAPEM